MLAIFVVVLAALAVVAISFSTYLSMVSSSNQVTKALEERRLVNDWALSIQQSMRPLGLNRQLIVPNGQQVAGNDYLLPPESINLQSKNSWGRDIIYCPFSITDGSGSETILAGDGDSYSASVVTDSNGVEYVYSVNSSSDPTNTDIVAAIISPIPAETNPSCLDIRFDSTSGDYYVSNYDGIVYPIVYSGLIVSNQAKSVFLNSGSSAQLSDEFSDWSSIRPDSTNVVLESRTGEYTTSSISFINDGQSKSKSISMRGNGVSVSKLNSSSASFVFDNVTVNLKDLSFGSGISVQFINSDITLDNVILNNVSFVGSDVSLKGNTTLISGGSPLSVVDTDINGSEAILTIQKDANIGAELTGSKLSLEKLTINNQSSNGVGVVIGQSSSVIIAQSLSSSGSFLDSVLGVASGGSFNNSNINVNIFNSVDTFLFNQGNVYLDNVFINFNSSVITGIILGLNSDTVINQVQLGSGSSRPDVGVRDIGGAKFIGGFNVIVFGQSACWVGDIFESSAPNANGTTSEATFPSAKSSNRSVWNCDI